MTDRPILFSAPMVRAILADRKTQTRRIIKPDPGPYWNPVVGVYNPIIIKNGGYEDPGPEIFGASDEEQGFKCPYGKPGDRLWVRETHAPQPDCWAAWDNWMIYSNRTGPKPIIHYAADGGDPWIDRWRPSIHMPRWASRITLEVTGVRIERLHSISDDDAIAEGIAQVVRERLPRVQQCGEYDSLDIDPVSEYRDIWCQINGPGSWGANPWIWVVEFRREKPCS